MLGGCFNYDLPYPEDGLTDAVDVVDPDTALDPDLDPDLDTALDSDPDVPVSTPGFVTISPDTYTMGSPTGEPGRYSDETEHMVTLTGSFEIMEKEVTQGQFEGQMEYNPSGFGSCGADCPVETVNWHEAAAYANAVSTGAGLDECYTCTGSGDSVTCEPSASYATPYDCPGYRLPTEAEWEYAARAGTPGGTYNGTSTLTLCESPNSVLDPIAWFCGNASSMTHSVGEQTPNSWELHDILGNVLEWCHDWYDSYGGAVTDPWGPETGESRVLRGGSWSDGARSARAAARNYRVPDIRTNEFGFRLARSLP
jgi:formylglycine-generating enzyme required for sulfatase activity